MTETARVIIIPAGEDEPIQIKSASTAYADIKAAVDDVSTSAVMFNDTPAVLFVGDNGKNTGAVNNPRATVIVDRFVPGFAKVDHIVGPAILFGTDAEGDRADVPAVIEEFVRNMFRNHTVEPV